MDMTSKPLHGDMLENIFLRQQELADTYGKIEMANQVRHVEGYPLDMNTWKGQAQIKDFMGRVTEECCEYLDAVMTPIRNDERKEELVDVWHFMIELCLALGMDAQFLAKAIGGPSYVHAIGVDNLKTLWQIKEGKNDFPLAFRESPTLGIIYYLWRAANQLKLKPWKQKYVPVDFEQFQDLFLCSFIMLILVTRDIVGMNPKELYEAYWSKSSINKTRQATGY